ncbi:hypothetical protein HDU81_000505 [Chytriomyces hyalinus]|nr:hypothetical protein HDU81_000505 [Chytriomyces hyalinus]
MHKFSVADEKVLSNRSFIEAEVAKLNKTSAAATAPQPVTALAAQDSTETDRDVVVCVRARPLLQHELDRGLFTAVSTSEASVSLHSLEFKVNGAPKLSTKAFPLDYAFGPESTNEQVYNCTARTLIPIALGGGVGSLFASGQTGSGKTHTMTAMEHLIARDLFQVAREYRAKQDSVDISTVSESADFEFHASFFELLGNKATDLLNYPNELTILEDVQGQVQVKDLAEQKITSPAHLLAVLTEGATRRKTQETMKNSTSSRSHAICRIRIRNTRFSADGDDNEGLLYLLDLAGSEDSADSRAHSKERHAESILINKSLATLKECIRNRALAVLSTKHVHIPYRNSKLTILLKSAFELSSNVACKTVVVATLNPSVLDTAHSVNTLRYVSPLKVEVPAATETNPNDPASWSNAKLSLWVQEASEGVMDASIICPTESGKQLLKIPEAAFIERCLQCPGVGTKTAKAFYNKLWRLVVDARTKIRKDKEDQVRKLIALRKLEGQKDMLEYRQRLLQDPEAFERWKKAQEFNVQWEKDQEEKLQSDPVAMARWREDRKAAKEYAEQCDKELEEFIDETFESGTGTGWRAIGAKMKEIEEKMKQLRAE